MRKVLIAGGGIAGVAAALGFARAGWSAEVIEAADALAEVGAGLQMSPNACKALDALGVLHDVRAASFVPEAAEMRDAHSGAPIYRAALGQAAEDRWGAPYLHVHRADLLDVLAGAASKAGAQLHLGRRVERFVDHGAKAALHLDDGAIIEGDLVLGADGIRSSLRKAIVPDETPRFTGQVAWRALVPSTALPPGLVPPHATVWAGPGGHVVMYYLRGGSLLNVVAVREQDAWTDEGWSAPSDPESLRSAFTDWHPTVQTVLEAVQDCFLWGLFDRPEQVQWTKGRLVLIGDAAHPMLPFMAQGAAMALEDVVVLERHLRSDALVADALLAYEDERWPRVTCVLQRARANGVMFHRRPGLGRWMSRLPLTLISRMAPGLAAGQLDWLYGHDPS